MESQGNEAERLLELLEELRLLLASSLPVVSTPQNKLSWEDVWGKGSYGPKPTTTGAQGIRGRSRLSDQYTRALRALRHSSF